MTNATDTPGAGRWILAVLLCSGLVMTGCARGQTPAERADCRQARRDVVGHAVGVGLIVLLFAPALALMDETPRSRSGRQLRSRRRRACRGTDAPPLTADETPDDPPDDEVPTGSPDWRPSAAYFEQSLRPHRPALHRCMPPGAERLRIMVRVDGASRGVSDFAVTSDPDDSVAACVGRALGEWQTPPFEGRSDIEITIE